jgi:peptidoglycan/xylan/chitin deacetylase (PgdA/CDA1 family)
VQRADLANGPLGSVVNTLMYQRPGGGWSTLVVLHPGPKFDQARLEAALAGMPDVQVVDVGRELAGLYQRYLHEAFVQVLLGALAVVVLLGIYLRSWRRLLAVCQPLLFAVMLTLGGMALAQAALGILHLVGLLLIVAVGSNYALFFDQLRVDRAGRRRHAGLADAGQPDDGGVVRPDRDIGHSGAVVNRSRGRAGRVAGAAAVGSVRAACGEAVRTAQLMGKSASMSSAVRHPSESWPWPPAMRASAAWHVAAIGAGVLVPGAWPWAIGAIVLNHALITGAGLTPRSKLLGPNVTRLPEAAAARREVAITIDDGPEPEVTSRVLDLLDAHGQRATFFCIAERVLAHPELAREIVARGHSIQNHTARHRHNFSFLGPRGFASEIARAQDILTEVTGQRPTCFRAPAGLRNPFLEPVLHRLGLSLVSWTRRGFDTREGDPAKVMARLARNLQARDILLLHDGNAARTAEGKPVLLEVLPLLLERLRADGLRAVTLPEGMKE